MGTPAGSLLASLLDSTLAPLQSILLKNTISNVSKSGPYFKTLNDFPAPYYEIAGVYGLTCLASACLPTSSLIDFLLQCVFLNMIICPILTL